MAATNEPPTIAINDRTKTPSLTGKQQKNFWERTYPDMFDQQTEELDDELVVFEVGRNTVPWTQ